MTDRPPIRFRGRSFLAMVLAPVPPIDQWLAELDALKQRAPAFFAVRAIILDVTGLRFERSDLAHLCEELNRRSITILGIEGIGPTSLGPGFPPPLVGGKPVEDIAPPESGAAASAPAEAPTAQAAAPALVAPGPAPASLLRSRRAGALGAGDPASRRRRDRARLGGLRRRGDRRRLDPRLRRPARPGDRRRRG
ncbi:hypothetical protein GCM10025880_40520 [Methylorubrum aminovorans]|nr:hypothetical protein GCM10025880_40520 [Methylorubrum aminovorans]